MCAFKMPIIFLFMFCIVYVNCNIKKEIFQKAEVDFENLKNFDSIANCIVEISKIDIYFKPIVLILKKENQNFKENAFINQIIDVLVWNKRPMLIVKDINILKGTEFHYGNILTIVYFDSCDSFSNVNQYIEEKRVKYLIIVDDDIEKSCMKLLKETGKYVNLYPITFMIKDSDNKDYKLISFVPEIDGNTCEFKDDLQPTYLNRCKNGTIEKVTSYPVKNPRNFQRCPLSIGLAHLPPYSIFPNYTSLEPFDIIEEPVGSDVEIVNILMKFLNATAVFQYSYKIESNPFVFDFVKYLVNGSLHACLGGMYRFYGEDLLDYSGIYNRDSVIWIYTAEREQRSWRVFATKIKDVYVFFVFYIFYCIFWKLFSVFDGNRSSLYDTMLYSFGVMISTSSLQKAKTLKSKILNLFYLIMCLYLSFYVSVQLYVFLTIQLPPELLKTNEDVANSGRPPMLNPGSRNFTSESSYTKIIKNSLDCDDFFDCVNEILLHKGITMVFDGIFYYFQETTAVNYEARLLRTRDNMLTVYHEILIKKNSPIVQNFQKVIIRLFDAGICDKLYHEAIGLTRIARANSYSKNIRENSYSCQEGCEITLKQASGIFYFWLLGCFVSFCVFIIELLSKRNNVIVL